MTFLLESEKEELLSQLKKARDVRIYERLKAILWLNDGKSKEEIASLLYLSSQTIYRYIQEYKNNKNLKPNHKGSTSKLSKEKSKKLSKHLEEKTYTNVKEISDYVSKTYKISYSNSGMTNWLHENGFSYKKPVGIPAKANEELQKEFVKKYEEIEKNLKKEEEIVFIDSCHPSQSTKLSYGWIKKGKDKGKEIKTTGSRTRVNVSGAINIKTREVISANYDTINSKNVINFLEKILENYPKSQKIHVIADGAGYHKSDEVQDFLKDKKIKLHILPPYSPNLNPIERLWKIMNEYVRNNKYYKTAKEFRSAIDQFFDSTIPTITKELCSRINSNFQIIKTTS